MEEIEQRDLYLKIYEKSLYWENYYKLKYPSMKKTNLIKNVNKKVFSELEADLKIIHKELLSNLMNVPSPFNNNKGL